MFFKKTGLRKNKRRHTYARKKRVVAGRKRSSVSVAVKKYVNKTLHKTLENKMTQIYNTGSFGPYATASNFNAFPMLPYTSYMTIAQGVKSNERVGNVIKTRKVMLNYVLRPNGYDATSNLIPKPCEVQMWLGNLRQATGVLPQTSDFGLLFQLNSSAIPPTGGLEDLCLLTNKDHWTIKKYWTHKIGNSIYNGASGIQPLNEYYGNNDYKYNVVRKMDITKLCAKTVKFDDATSVSQSANLFFFYQAVACDGTILASSQLPINISWFLTYEYEDA